MRVRIFKPPRGRRVTKLVHRWQGPAAVVESAGFDNFLVGMERQVRGYLHSSSMVNADYPEPLLDALTDDLDTQLEAEDDAAKRAVAEAPRMYGGEDEQWNNEHER